MLCWDQDAMRYHGLTAAAWPALRRLDKRSSADIVVDRPNGLSVHVTMARPSVVLYAQASVTLTDRTAVYRLFSNRPSNGSMARGRLLGKT